MLKQGATFLDLKGNGIWADAHPEMRENYNAQETERAFVQNARTLYGLSKHLPQKGLWGLATDHYGDTIYIYTTDRQYKVPDDLPYVQVPPGGPHGNRPIDYKALGFETKRSPVSRARDEARANVRLIPQGELTSKRLKSWKRRPGRSDITGVDSPKRKPRLSR